MDYQRNACYFQPTQDFRPPSPCPPRKPTRKRIIITLIVGVIIALILLLSQHQWWALIALLIALISCLPSIGVPSDAEIDAARDSYMDSLKEWALKKLGIDEEEAALAPPLFLKGYSLGTRNDKLGRDEIWRSPECVLSAFFFTENEIHYYRATISLVSDSKKEFTSEFFYKDIVSIKTEDIEKPVIYVDPKTNTLKESQTRKAIAKAFMLRNASGETTTCICNSTEEADNAVSAMRNLIRQKKNA